MFAFVSLKLLYLNDTLGLPNLYENYCCSSHCHFLGLIQLLNTELNVGLDREFCILNANMSK